MASVVASTSAVAMEDLPMPPRQLYLHCDYAVKLDKDAAPKRATVLSTRYHDASADGRLGKSTSTKPPILQVYVHWVGMDPRLDCWLDEHLVGDQWTALDPLITPPPEVKPAEEEKGVVTRHKRKAKEGSSPIVKISSTGVGAPNVSLQPRSITSVIFGWHEIKTWYDSPYQLEEVHSNMASNALHPAALASALHRSSTPTSRPTSAGPRPSKKPRLDAPPMAADVALKSLPVPVVDVSFPAPDPPRSPRRAPRSSLANADILHREDSVDAIARSLVPGVDGNSEVVSAPPSHLSLAHDAVSPLTSPDLDPPIASTSALPTPIVLIDSRPPTPKRSTKGRFAPTDQPTKKQLRQFGSAPSSAPTSVKARAESPAVPAPAVTSGARPKKELQLVPATGLANLKDGKLYVCDGCFKYMAYAAAYEAHRKECKVKYPPGRKVWQRGMQTIWEVDGAKNTLWCQNLCLFGKLFIDHKYVFFDVEGFLFYVLCEGDGARDYMLGFFSKEKISYDDYNLACVIIIPPFSRRSYGALLIELSYALHARTPRAQRLGIAGTPERPLSDLGLRSYLSFWLGVLVRYLRRLLDLGSVKAVEAATKRERLEAERAAMAKARQRAKKNKGWIEADVKVASEGPPSSPARPAPPEGVRITIAELARVTGLRVDDAILALASSGLLALTEDGAGQLVVTAEAVERVAVERKVRPALLDMTCMLPLEEEP